MDKRIYEIRAGFGDVNGNVAVNRIVIAVAIFSAWFVSA